MQLHAESSADSNHKPIVVRSRLSCASTLHGQYKVDRD